MIKTAVLKKYRDYRLLFLSQMISYLGNMVSYVVVPYQVYQMSQSSLTVSLLSFVQLGPVLFFGLLGGSVADRVDRKKLLISAEILMALCSLGLAANAHWGAHRLETIFILVFLLQAASSYHRPAMEAVIQKIVPAQEFDQVATLSTFSYTMSAILGPALGGWILVALGVPGAYLFDFLTFIVSLMAATLLTNNYKIIKESHAPSSSLSSDLKIGLQFAYQNKPLLASYLVDIVAMTFAFPVALFPEIASKYGMDKDIGWLYSAMAIGALTILAIGASKFSRIQHRGKAITLAAVVWGVGIILYGFSYTSLIFSVLCLAIAGAGDTVSGIQRRVLWNEVIPNNMRGRLAGIEMISYLSGPLLGNFRSALFAQKFSIQVSLISGGVLCTLILFGFLFWFPTFWNYKSDAASSTN